MSMASTQSTASTDTHHNPHFDELRWVIQIRHTLEEEHDDDMGIPVSVFNVPKCLQVTKPEAYVPQLIAVGPYHHWRPELYEMERYKLAAARRTQKQFHTIKLQHLIEQFTKFEHKIRAHYHRSPVFPPLPAMLTRIYQTERVLFTGTLISMEIRWRG